MGLLSGIFALEAAGGISKLGTLDNPLDRLLSHVSDIGNVGSIPQRGPKLGL